MNVNTVVLLFSLVLNALMGLGYLMYSAMLINIAMASCSGAWRVIFLVGGALLLVYACVNFGGFDKTASLLLGFNNARSKKGEA